MEIIARLNQIIDERHLLNHPYYIAWSKGELSMESLKNYAIQYYHQVKSFPRFISRVHTHCPEISVRKALLENLVDEEIHGKDHPQLWMQFAEGLGATREQVMHAEAIAETQSMVDVYYDLADQDWRDGLCALYAYECQVPAVSASKIEGLKKFYGVTDQGTLEFFTAHQVYDIGHSMQVAKLIEAHVDPIHAEQATRRAADALWGFLDGMCRVEGIECHAA